MKKILLIRLSSFGDVILTEPLCRALRKKFPDAEIDYLTKEKFAPIVERFGSVSNVLIYDEAMKGIGYDAVLDLHNVLRTKRIRKRFGSNVSVINKRTIKRWLLVKLKINLLKNSPDIIGRYFETASSLGVIDTGQSQNLHTTSAKTKTAALIPGARHWNKRWPTKNFIEVGKHLHSIGYQIVIHGSSDESPLSDEIVASIPTAVNMCGKFSLAEIPDELAKCELAVTNDSGLMHLANAVGVKTTSIFGPTVKQFGFYPRTKNAIVIENSLLTCRPCTTIGSNACPKGHFHCMIQITPENIIPFLET